MEFSLGNCLNETNRVGVDQSIKSVETQLQNWTAIFMNYSDIESRHMIQEFQDVQINDIINVVINVVLLGREGASAGHLVQK